MRVNSGQVTVFKLKKKKKTNRPLPRGSKFEWGALITSHVSHFSKISMLDDQSFRYRISLQTPMKELGCS